MSAKEKLKAIKARLEMRIEVTKNKEQKAVNSRSWGAASNFEAQVAAFEEALFYIVELENK